MGFVLLVLFALFYFSGAVIEAEVAEHVKGQLERAGYRWAYVEADGQEVTIHGPPPEPVPEMRLADVVWTTRCDTLFGRMPCPTDVRIQLDPPVILTTSSSTSEPADEPPTAPAASNPRREHDFIFEVINNGVVLRGDVPTDEERRRLLKAAGTSFGSVVDELRVTNDPATPQYTQASKSALELIALLVSGRATWRTGKFGAGGVVAEGRDAEVRQILETFERSHRGALDLLTENEAAACDEDFASILGRSKIQFRTGSAAIRGESMSILEEIASVARQCPVTLQVDGHTDNVGSPSFNDRLSLQRADTVAQALEDRGIPRARLAPRGFGPQRPIADNRIPEGRAKNRRIEIRIRR